MSKEITGIFTQSFDPHIFGELFSKNRKHGVCYAVHFSFAVSL
jgi:hypothetical protein